MDLLVFTAPPTPNPRSSTIRPYTAQDEVSLHNNSPLHQLKSVYGCIDPLRHEILDGKHSVKRCQRMDVLLPYYEMRSFYLKKSRSTGYGHTTEKKILRLA